MKDKCPVTPGNQQNMAKHIKRGGQRNWSNVSSSEISSVQWPFRYCDIIEAESCEEILGTELWDKIQSRTNRQECIKTWNEKQVIECRHMISRRDINFGNPHELARNLFNILLLKHFEDSYLAVQKITLQPFEIYVAPGSYVKYKPQIDICLLDSSGDGAISLKIIELCSGQDIEDSFYQTMFYTLSGNRSTAYCFVIKETGRGCFKIFVGKIDWPIEILQMMMICGSDVSRQLGFNHRIHSKSIIAKYACLGTVYANEDDSLAVSLFLNTINELAAFNESTFLPLTKNMQSVVEKRKTTHKHMSDCIFGVDKVCNAKFEESSSWEDNHL